MLGVVVEMSLTEHFQKESGLSLSFLSSRVPLRGRKHEEMLYGICSEVNLGDGKNS